MYFHVTHASPKLMRAHKHTELLVLSLFLVCTQHITTHVLR
jgi:hypothetical protein